VLGLKQACNVFRGCLATSFLMMWLGPVGAWVWVPLMFVLVLIFCDITPKTFALGFPGGIAQITARPLAAMAKSAHPLTKFFVPTTEPPRPQPVSEEEFKALLRAGEILGEVEPQERELIYKVFDFGNRRVVEIMTPRDKIFSLSLSTPAERLMAEVASGHFSRVPIY